LPDLLNLPNEFYGKLDEVKSRIDWLKDLFKILIAIMAVAIASLAKLFLITHELQPYITH